MIVNMKRYIIANKCQKTEMGLVIKLNNRYRKKAKKVFFFFFCCSMNTRPRSLGPIELEQYQLATDFYLTCGLDFWHN